MASGIRRAPAVVRGDELAMACVGRYGRGEVVRMRAMVACEYTLLVVDTCIERPSASRR